MPKRKPLKSTYGGWRLGAGRKPLDPSKKRRHQVYLTDDELKVIQAMRQADKEKPIERTP